MGRIVQNWRPEPVTEALPYRNADYFDCDRLREARDASPYKEGDVFWVNLGTARDPAIKRARVLHVFAERLERAGYCIPKYSVQTETANGLWSKVWCYTYPGNIYRAYFDENEEPRNHDTP